MLPGFVFTGIVQLDLVGKELYVHHNLKGRRRGEGMGLAGVEKGYVWWERECE